MTIDRLSALDRLMLWASRRWPQDIGVLGVLDGGPLLDAAGEVRIDAVRDAVGARLDRCPRFRQLIQRPGRGLGGPFWVDAPTFDVADHVRVWPLEAPGQAELLSTAEALLRRPFDPRHPLWELWLLPGLPDRRVGLFVKVHHAVADGVAVMATLASLLEVEGDGPPASAGAWTPRPWPSDRELLVDNLGRRAASVVRTVSVLGRPRAAWRTMRAAVPAIREIIAEQPADATSLDRTVGAGRRVALIQTDLSRVKAVAAEHGATVNDMLLAATAGGLRALLGHRGEPLESTTVRIYVPVSLRRDLSGPQLGNQIAQMAVPLRMGESDAPRRLEEIAAETRHRKARLRTSLATLMVGGAIGRRLMLAAVMRQRVNVTSASIRGPEEARFLAGARLLEVFPILPLVANEPLAVGALSYAGTLAIGIAADRDPFPDLDVLVGGVRDELRALGVESRPALAPTAGPVRRPRSSRSRCAPARRARAAAPCR